MHPAIDAIAPAVELQLEVDRVREAPTGQKVGAHEPVRALEHALGLGVAGVEDDPADPELPAERRECIGRAASGAIAPSRSHTSFSGSAPILLRQRPRPQRMSGACLEKINAPASTRDQHNSKVTTQPRLLWP